MNALLRIDVRWLDDRYHGEEWPPSPFKLQQALIRVVADQGMESLNATLPLLGMLESKPSIEHVPASRGRPMRLSVPNNGGGNTMRPRRAWFLNRAPKLPDVRYLFHVASDTERLSMLVSLLHRVHTLGLGIDAAYIEADICNAEESYCLPNRIEPMGSVASGASASNADVGYGAGLVENRNQNFAIEHTLRWRVIMPGGTRLVVQEMGKYFERLQSLWEEAARKPKRRSRLIKPAVSISRPADIGFERIRYRAVSVDQTFPQDRPVIASSRYQVVTFNVEPSSGVFPETTFSAKLAAMMRHACHELIKPYVGQDETWNRFLQGPVCGHGTDPNKRIAFAPLPSFTGSHPDGRLRRVLVAVPETVSAEFPAQVRELLFRIRGGIELLQVPAQKTGNMSDQKFAFLMPVEPDDHTFGLCLDSSETWSSVTPVVLHGHDRRRSGRISSSKIERMIGSALKQVGLETLLAHYEVSQVCFVPGLPLAHRYFRPENLGGSNRTVCHLKLIFNCAVSGPVLLGLGRHRGLGLFTAT